MARGKGGNGEKRKRFNNKYPRDEEDKGGKERRGRKQSPMGKYMSINGQYISPNEKKDGKPGGKKEIFKIRNTGLWRNAKVLGWQRCGNCVLFHNNVKEIGCKKCKNTGYINLVAYKNDKRNRKNSKVPENKVGDRIVA